LKTIDDDYGGDCYDCKGVKRAAVFAREIREDVAYMQRCDA
jgi:hypothetical protein